MAHHFLPSSHPYIKQAFLVADHKIDQTVRTRISEAEKHFSDFVKGEAKSTNVDANTPPPIPRLIISDGGKSLSISQSRVQLEFNFEPDFEFERSLSVVMNKAFPFLKAVSTFQTVDSSCMIGFVVHVQWPSTQNRTELSELLSAHFYAAPKLGRVDAFECKIGFLSDSFLFKNVNVAAYETREVMVPTTAARGTSITVEIDKMPVIESGISFSIDVNNRGRRRAEGEASYDFLSTAAEIVFEMNNLLLKDIYTVLPVLKSKS